MNIPKLFRYSLIKNSQLKILSSKKNNLWKCQDRKTLNNMINYSIDVLKDHKVRKGDRVVYKGKNSIEWVAWNIATNSIGAVWVPLYSNQTEDYCQYIVNDCTPKILVSDDEPNYTNLKFIDNHIEDIDYNNEFNIVENDLSTLIYTSGTTGNPKGVMLSHKNILSNIDSIKKRFVEFNDIQEMKSLNILPWAHIYGLTCELYYNLLNDNKVVISSGVDNFVKEISEIKPDVLFLVPKILELIKTKLSILDKPLIRQILPFVLNKLFGGNLLTIFMGGAKLDENTRAFYLDNGIIISEGYGCSETSPMISLNHMVNPRDINSIGKILDNVIVEIINGEICVAGPNVMEGYWQNEEATKNCFVKKNEQNFYKTGDAGRVKNGFLYYEGRISENYKLTNGKFVNINDLESKLKKFIPNFFIVYGEDRPYNILIIEKPFDENLLNEINENLDSFVRINKLLLVDKDVFAKHLTPKMSIKRKKLVKYLTSEINKLYN